MRLAWLHLTVLALPLAGADLTPEAEFAACQPKAAAGNVKAQNELGWRYNSGNGTAKDQATAVIWFRKAADKGYPNAQRNLGLAYLFGEGVAEDQATAVKWLTLAAKQEDPSAEYYLGQCYQNGFGVTRDIDVGFRWQYLAALHGYTITSEFTPAEKAALREWTKSHAETQVLIQDGQLGKAYLSEKDALGIATEKLREKRWPAVASAIRLLEIAIKQKRWSQAYQHYITAQHGALNALADVIEKPTGIELPEYMAQTAKLLLKRKVAEKNGKEGIRLLDEQIAVLQLEFGRDNLFLAPTLKERADVRYENGLLKESDEDYAHYLRLNREYLGQDDEIMGSALMDYARHLGRRQLMAEQVAVLQEALNLNLKTSKIGYAYTWIKGSLLKAQVTRRFLDGEEFQPASNLPSTEAELRKLADAGDPMACFRLSVGLSSGEFRSRVTIEMAELSPESKLYQDASVVPFIDDTKITVGYFDEKIARRFVRLGHGFAQYELSNQLTRQNNPWPKVAGLAGNRRDTEVTKESYELLCLAAEAGVPAAIHELGSLSYYGQYNHEGNSLNDYTPFVGTDGHWYKRIYIPETKGKQTIQRLTDDPVIVRKDYAMAAYFQRKDFRIGKDVNAAYHLGVIYAEGARESSRGSFRGIEYPAIIPDKVEAAAYFYVCLYAKDFYLTSKDGLEEILQELRLSPAERQAAQQRAKELLASRVRG
jgi:TPR repeat protein